MNPTPDQPDNEDLEGHFRRVDAEAVTEDDAEGHLRRMDTEAMAEDDVEGHMPKQRCC